MFVVGRRRLALCLVLSASLSLAPAASAQTASGDWSAVRAVAAGSKLSVQLKSGRSVKGKLTGVSDDGLSLTAGGKTTDIKAAEVQRVYTVGGGSGKKGALIGLAVGAGAGAVAGAAADSASDDGFEGFDAAATAGLTVLGAAAGALTGYFLGRRGGKRVLVYEAR
jgi:hypothetical protein